MKEMAGVPGYTCGHIVTRKVEQGNRSLHSGSQGQLAHHCIQCEQVHSMLLGSSSDRQGLKHRHSH